MAQGVRGKVTLVGAGPGDRDLLTVKGWKALKEADVIFYDRLLGEGLFEFFPDQAERVDVGKNVARHPVPQEEINQELLKQAMDGKKVVRLKGGDPYIFGRGFEELQLLQQYGVDFEVIPGVTSFIGASSYSGIPITHRGVVSSFHVFTGHGKGGEPIHFDFDAIAKMGGTLIFMMSLANAQKIADGLLGAGVAESMPSAIIENATVPTQRAFRTVLNKLTETIQKHEIHSPAIILIGDVCGVSPSCDWFSRLPLRGRSFLVTRPSDVAGRLSEKLTAYGASVTVYPCIKRTPIPFDCDRSCYSTLVFTSAFGVETFFSQLWARGADCRELGGKTLCAVGSETAEVLKKYGLRADFFPETYDGEHLAKGMIARGFHKKGDIALFRAQRAAPELPRLLAEAGATVHDIAVYATESCALSPAQGERWDGVCFTSASCVCAFVAANPNVVFSEITCFCIGEKTREAALAVGMNAIVSERATLEDMVEKIVEVCGYVDETKKA